jgi:hypothetical protein
MEGGDKHTKTCDPYVNRYPSQLRNGWATLLTPVCCELWCLSFSGASTVTKDEDISIILQLRQEEARTGIWRKHWRGEPAGEGSTRGWKAGA